MTKETFPQWWVQRRCIHWTTEKNRRFRLVRIDGPSDHCGVKPAHQYDAENGTLSRMPYGARGHELLRPATATEIPGDLFLEILDR